MRRGGDRTISSVCRLPRLPCNQKSQQIKFETWLLKGKDKHNSNMIQRPTCRWADVWDRPSSVGPALIFRCRIFRLQRTEDRIPV
jgi:hypothetical protein